MRLIHPKLHAGLDYCIALLSILSPVLFGFGTGKYETLVPVCFGLLIILYSFMTDYGFGMSRQLSLDLHLRIDQFVALLMIATPWLMNFKEVVFIPLACLGLALLVSSFLTGNDISQLMQLLRQRPWMKWFRMPSGQ